MRLPSSWALTIAIARQAQREHCETLQELDKLDASKSSMTRLSRDEHDEQGEIIVYISVKHDYPHGSCSILFSYLVIAFIVEAYEDIILILVRLFLDKPLH